MTNRKCKVTRKVSRQRGLYTMNRETRVILERLFGTTIPKAPNCYIEFKSEDDKALLEIYVDGRIFWRGRLVTADCELVAALRDVILENKCPEILVNIVEPSKILLEGNG